MDFSGIQNLVIVSVLLTTVICQQSQLIVPNPVTAGQPFTVTCDASVVLSPELDVTGISSLHISRNVTESTTEVTISHYDAIVIPGEPTAGPTSTDRGNITYTGGDITDSEGHLANRNTMKIVLQVWSARCEDVGMYHCGVNYFLPDNTVRFASASFNVTAIAATTSFDLTIEPDVINREYKVGQNITFTCRIQGPKTLTFRWDVSLVKNTNEQDVGLPSDAVRTDKPAEVLSTNTGCTVYQLESTVSVPLSNGDETERYACIVLDGGNREVERQNITISIDKVNDKASGRDPNVGLIVGLVAVCVVLVADFQTQFPLLRAL
jgi:hypothetical protein